MGLFANALRGWLTSACAQGRLEALNAEETRLMRSAGEVFAASQAASRAADLSEAWKLMPDLGAGLLAANCLRLLQGDDSSPVLFHCYEHDLPGAWRQLAERCRRAWPTYCEFFSLRTFALKAMPYSLATEEDILATASLRTT